MRVLCNEPYNGWRSKEVNCAQHESLCLAWLWEIQNFPFWWHPFCNAFQKPFTHLSHLHRMTSALVPFGLRCLTFPWIISVRATSGLSHFWDYSSERCPTFQMPFVDRLFLCFLWLQIWKPAKWRGWVQRFFQLKVQLLWLLSSSNENVIKLLYEKSWVPFNFISLCGRWRTQSVLTLSRRHKPP